MEYVRYSFVVSDRELLERFRRVCDERGYKYGAILSALMRYYIEHRDRFRYEGGRLISGQDSPKNTKE